LLFLCAAFWFEIMGQSESRSINQLLENATPEQVKWVLARLVQKTDALAAKEIGMHPSTVCRWPNKADLDKAVMLYLRQPIDAALSILQEAAVDAAVVKVGGLKSKKDTIRQSAATEILDRNIGKPKQTQEVEGSLQVRHVAELTDEQLASIASRSGK
jgi:mannose/fructose/N-acetylgalactosamine-specific phosphotransferase system component IIB